jgi:soluble lytic murein transglycosylase-like protein
VIVRESRYNPRAVGRGGTMGLMQIKTATARGVGYTGDAAGLLDADTNLTYGVRYLAGAWRTAGGNPDRAIAYYAGGYYYHAKRQGLNARALARAPMPIAPTLVAEAGAPAEAVAAAEASPVLDASEEPLSAVSPADKEFPH